MESQSKQGSSVQPSLSAAGIPWSLLVPSGINCITNDKRI